MGHPKKQRKKLETPKKPWDKARLERESKVRKDFGLRRKREIWRAESILRDLRRRARELQARPDEAMQKSLFMAVENFGMHAEKLDDVLSINLEDILSRRLQTIIYKKGLANSIKQARQIIVHGHVYIKDRKIPYPAYIVPKGDEEELRVDDRVVIAKPAPSGAAEEVKENE